MRGLGARPRRRGLPVTDDNDSGFRPLFDHPFKNFEGVRDERREAQVVLVFGHLRFAVPAEVERDETRKLFDLLGEPAEARCAVA